MNGKDRKKVLVLDFGSQYTHLIARRVRELNIYSEIVPCRISMKDILKENPGAIILSGGPASVLSKNSPRCERDIFFSGIPVLGICYGCQLMAKELGGKVESSTKREYGPAVLEVIDKFGLFKNLGKKEPIWMSHGDRVIRLPAGFKAIGATANSPVAAMSSPERKLYGVQFHPEVAHTPKGKTILKNFVMDIAGIKPTWTMRSFVEGTIAKIQAEVGREKVICALSGGVDSSVLAMLLHKAIGKNLIAIFIDNGLLRKGEKGLVRKRFEDAYKLNLRVIDAENLFLKRLKGVIEPERKRKIIGHTFINVFEKEAGKLGRVKFLAQGTLYPDVIESRSPYGGPSATIKTHHNVGGLPPKLKFKLIEPLKELFKDEVRAVGRELGLPKELLNRHPFPGPGLAVRILGEVTKERLATLREADWLLIDEIKKAGLYEKLWQSFAVLLPVKSVGVMGDERTYEDVCAIRAVISEDAMTAQWARLPYALMERISSRIINEVKGINRVVYDISSKPPATIEWE